MQNYNFDKTPFENAYDEVNSRIIGNADSAKNMIEFKNYLKCNRTSKSPMTECNENMKWLIDPPAYFKWRSDGRMFVKPKSVNEDSGSGDTFRSKYISARQNLENECPNYNLMYLEPMQTEKCYIASLKFWVEQFNISNPLYLFPGGFYRTSVKYSSMESDYLRKHFFGKINTFYSPPYVTLPGVNPPQR